MTKSIYHEMSGETMNNSDAQAFTIQYQDGSSGLEIVIYSSQLIDLLKKACTNYPGSEYQALFKPSVCFKDPFMMLFYNMDTILEMKGFVEEEELKEAVNKLLELKPMSFYPATVNQRSGLSDAIAFHDLWLLYRPGTTVYRLPSCNLYEKLWKNGARSIGLSMGLPLINTISVVPGVQGNSRSVISNLPALTNELTER